MKRGASWLGIGAGLGMLVLILDSKTAMAGASQGVELCIRTVIPALFPLMLLSNQLMDGLRGTSSNWLRPIGQLFSMPEGMEGLLIPAFLGGYPVGAQCIGAEYRNGNLSKETAEKLLAYCSNAGPSFLFGMAGSLFSISTNAWKLWGIQILSALLVSKIVSASEGICDRSSIYVSGSSIATSVKVMGCICGWVVLFRVWIAFLDRWFLWLLPSTARIIVVGALELSNGCNALFQILQEPIRFVLCSGMLSFGGICVLLQTKSVINGLSIRPYLLGKLMQTGFSVALAIGCLWNIWITSGITVGIFLLMGGKIRKSSRNPLTLGV